MMITQAFIMVSVTIKAEGSDRYKKCVMSQNEYIYGIVCHSTQVSMNCFDLPSAPVLSQSPCENKHVSEVINDPKCL